MKQAISKQSIGLSVVKALFFSYLVTGVILLLLALLMYKAGPPDIVIRAGIIFSYIASSFVGGFLAGKCAKSKRYLWGILIGILYFAILFAVSALLNKNALDQLGNTVMVFIMCSMGGMLGGMLS